MAAVTEEEKMHFESAAAEQKKVDINKELHFKGIGSQEKNIGSDKGNK